MSGATWRSGLQEAAAQAVPGNRMQRTALLALLLLAALLRMWDLPHIPYTHDEVSTLLRIHPSLAETIRKGVMALDVHPPGVQVFEWAWTKLFGMDEAVVKLPFILMSIAALFLLYRFAYAWTGGGVALVLTALLATLQYTVMYGQIARLYAAGLFTTALLADQLTRHLGSGSRRTLIGFGVAAVLSAYTQHFAMMLALFMAITGLLLVGPDRRKPYLVTCAVAALLYLPNIPILLAQLGQKGLSEWLPAPTATWLPDYLWWIAHCSWAMAAVLGALILGALFLRLRHRGGVPPLTLITLTWGLLPLAVGYAYSVWRAPVLQYSGVLFSFPYLLLGAIAGLRHMPSSRAIPVAFAAAAVAVATLISVRKHYEVFYRSRYEAMAHGIIEAAGQPDRIALFNAPGEMIDFYLDHWDADPARTERINLRDWPMDRVDSLLRTTTAGQVFYGQTADAPPEIAARIQLYFPFLTERHDYNEGQTLLFSAMPGPGALKDKAWESLFTPDAVQGNGWTADDGLPLWRDSTGHAPRRWDLSGREFGILLEKPVYEIAKGDNDIIEVRLDVEGITGPGLKLVAELVEGGQTTFYRSQPCPVDQGSCTLITAVALSDLQGHGHGKRLRAYVWNEGAGPALVSSMQVQVRPGNPWLYGLVGPLKGPLAFP